MCYVCLELVFSLIAIPCFPLSFIFFQNVLDNIPFVVHANTTIILKNKQLSKDEITLNPVEFFSALHHV